MNVQDNQHNEGRYRTILADPPWLYDYPGGPGHKAPWRIESRPWSTAMADKRNYPIHQARMP